MTSSALLRISVPGKSFIAGEYLALKGGPSLIFASHPRFELLASAGSGRQVGIHPESPAGKFMLDQQDFFKNYDVEFNDPHQGKGGWGASTAQFLAAFVLNEWRDSCELETLKSLSISRLLDAYWKYAWNGEGVRPSGADLICQYKGSLTLFEKQSGLISVFKWPFTNIDFALIPTGRKLATHEHLKSLSAFDESSLESAMRTLQKSLQAYEEATFVEGVRKASEALARLGFVADHTQQLLSQVRILPGVLAAKGCGALGADVMLAVYEKSQRQEFAKQLETLGLKIAATSEDISHGLSIEVRNTP